MGLFDNTDPIDPLLRLMWDQGVTDPQQQQAYLNELILAPQTGFDPAGLQYPLFSDPGDIADYTVEDAVDLANKQGTLWNKQVTQMFDPFLSGMGPMFGMGLGYGAVSDIPGSTDLLAQQFTPTTETTRTAVEGPNLRLLETYENAPPESLAGILYHEVIKLGRHPDSVLADLQEAYWNPDHPDHEIVTRDVPSEPRFEFGARMQENGEDVMFPNFDRIGDDLYEMWQEQNAPRPPGATYDPLTGSWYTEETETTNTPIMDKFDEYGVPYPTLQWELADYLTDEQKAVLARPEELQAEYDAKWGPQERPEGPIGVPMADPVQELKNDYLTAKDAYEQLMAEMEAAPVPTTANVLPGNTPTDLGGSMILPNATIEQLAAYGKMRDDEGNIVDIPASERNRELDAGYQLQRDQAALDRFRGSLDTERGRELVAAVEQSQALLAGIQNRPALRQTGFVTDEGKWQEPFRYEPDWSGAMVPRGTRTQGEARDLVSSRKRYNTDRVDAARRTSEQAHRDFSRAAVSRSNAQRDLFDARMRAQGYRRANEAPGIERDISRARANYAIGQAQGRSPYTDYAADNRAMLNLLAGYGLG